MRPLTWVGPHWRWFLGASVALVLTIALPAGPAATAQAQGACRFVLGFATLGTMIGAGAVGECRENQRSVANGNAEQLTTKGLVVWRKADNWTAFTDGNRTWINGPAGVQVRLNTDRFAWESDVQQVGRSAPSVIVERFLQATLWDSDEAAVLLLSRRLRAITDTSRDVWRMLDIQNTPDALLVRDPVPGPTPGRVTVSASLVYAGSPHNRNFQLIQDDGEWWIDAVTIAPY